MFGIFFPKFWFWIKKSSFTDYSSLKFQNGVFELICLVVSRLSKKFQKIGQNGVQK